MKKVHKKTIIASLIIPLVLAITFCCCVEEKTFAEGAHAVSSAEHHHGSHEVAKVDQSDHQNHSDENHECTCPKHLSFLSAQSVDIVLGSTSQTLAKIFAANVYFENIALLASLSSQTHGPPFQAHLDHVSIPTYLKIRNLRL